MSKWYIDLTQFQILLCVYEIRQCDFKIDTVYQRAIKSQGILEKGPARKASSNR